MLGWGGGTPVSVGGGLPSDSTSVPPEYKRARHEIKKKSSDTLKLQKKARKGEEGVLGGGGYTCQPLRDTPVWGRQPGWGTPGRWASRGSYCPPPSHPHPHP